MSDISETLRQRFDDPANTSAPERRVAFVELTKEAEYGIGLTIVGGENTGQSVIWSVS